MGLNVENTNKAIKRFKEEFDNDHYNGKIIVHDKSEYGCEAIEATIDKSISFGELERLKEGIHNTCLLYTSPSPRDRQKSRMPSSA